MDTAETPAEAVGAEAVGAETVGAEAIAGAPQLRCGALAASLNEKAGTELAPVPPSIVA